MNEVERLLRQAQEWQAGQAPDAERIRRALPGRKVRRTRRRRAGMAAFAAMVVLVIVVPAMLWPRASQPGRPVPSPPPAAPTHVDAGVVTLGYRPTWLPAGLHERFRGVTRTGTGELRIQRAWTAGAVGTTGGLPHRAVTVTVREAPGLRDPATTAAQTVDVDGRKAAVTGNSVAWRAGDGNVIEVATGVPMAPADLLRIARSMRVDGTAYAPPLVLGWAPAGWRDVAYEQSGDSGIDWNATAVLSDPDRPAARITVTLAPSTSTISAPPADAEIVDVGGRPAELSTRRGPDGQAVLDLVQRQENSAYQLTVSGPARDDLIRIAQQVSPSKEFDADWLD